MRRRRWWFLAGAVALAAVAALVAVRRGDDALPVDVEAVQARGRFRSYVTASGEVVATRFADIGSSVMGRLVELRVAEGDRVEAGQVVARIDPVQARSGSEAAVAGWRALEAAAHGARQQLDQARSDLAQAQARSREATTSLERHRLLARDGLATAAQLDTVEAAAQAAAALVDAAEAAVRRAESDRLAAERRVAQARAQADGARDILAKTEVAAPISGLVSRLQVRAGEMVVIGIQNQPGTTLMTISDMSAVDAEVKVAEADVLRVRPGQTAVVTLEALPGRSFSAKVVEVGASALPLVGAATAAREFKVKARLDQPDPALRPGLTCDVEILTAERTNVLTVPLQAVVLRANAPGADARTGVFVVRDGAARFVPVSAGVIGGLDVEVSGAAAGTVIVAGPYQTLRTIQDGRAVRAVAPPPQR